MHVILLAPHFPANQRQFARALKEVGARVTGICDARLEHIDHQVKGYLDDFEYVPNVTSVDAVEAAVRRIQARGPWVDRLEATVEAHMLTCAVVRERTHIPGLSSATVERCRDKFLMKKFLRDRGFPCAMDIAVTDGDSARTGIKELGYPVILKPRDGAGAHDTFFIHDEHGLESAIAETGLDHRKGFFTMEQFLTGHEGFYDTLTVNGKVSFDIACHYYPNVLQAMRTRSVNPMIMITNRISEPGYSELKDFGRKVIQSMGIGTSATHMEWFFGDQGLKFSEIGARPAGVCVWDLYSVANDMDLYKAWAEAICYGTNSQQPSRRFSAGLLSIRPDRDGVVQGCSGEAEIRQRYGKWIHNMHMPSPGSHTQPVSAGYRANGFVYAFYPDYDGCRAMLDDMARTLKIYAR